MLVALIVSLFQTAQGDKTKCENDCWLSYNECEKLAKNNVGYSTCLRPKLENCFNNCRRKEFFNRMKNDPDRNDAYDDHFIDTF